MNCRANAPNDAFNTDMNEARNELDESALRCVRLASFANN